MTVREIAAKMGVAPSTVSLVLNNKTGVREELRDRIRQVLEENGYTIRNTDTDRKNKTVLFVYYQSTSYIALRDDMTRSLMNEAQRVCQDNGCNFLYFVANHENLDYIFSGEHLKNVDGVILLGTEYYHKLSSAILNCSVPVVILDGYFPGEPVDTVNNNNEQLVRMLFRYLQEKGHKEIGYIKSRIPLGSLGERSERIQKNAADYGFVLKKEHILEVRSSTEEVMEDVKAALNGWKGNLPTVFICDNDYIAAAAMQVIQSSGLSIPGDISVIGVDNSELAKIVYPGLTTFQSDFQEMARQAARCVVDRMEQSGNSCLQICVGVRLVERNSVADLTK